jgi:hypothetical protein
MPTLQSLRFNKTERICPHCALSRGVFSRGALWRQGSGDSGRRKLVPLAAKAPPEFRETKSFLLKRVMPVKGCVLKKPVKFMVQAAGNGGLWAELSPLGGKMLGNGGDEGEY